MVSFTAHNIRLDDGTTTKPDLGYTMDQHPHFLAAKRLLSVVYSDPAGVRLADLGCLEGGYSVAFARLGFEVLGIEVREANISTCNFVKEKTNLPNLRFARDDVWNLGNYGDFDVIFCCGLFYHLDRPAEFLSLLGSMTKKVLILQTHFATDEPNEKYNLSVLCQHENGSWGRWQQEFSTENEFLNRENLRWASWENRKSFWLKREYLLQAVINAGFDICMEQFDQLGNISQSMTSGFYRTESRGTFIAMKSANAHLA